MNAWPPVALAEPDERVVSSPPAVRGLDAAELHALQRLGGEHTAWPEDAIVLSADARSWLKNAVRFIVNVFSFWDHRTRRCALPGGGAFIDSAGCLRIDGPA